MANLKIHVNVTTFTHTVFSCLRPT